MINQHSQDGNTYIVCLLFSRETGWMSYMSPTIYKNGQLRQAHQKTTSRRERSSRFATKCPTNCKQKKVEGHVTDKVSNRFHLMACIGRSNFVTGVIQQNMWLNLLKGHIFRLCLICQFVNLIPRKLWYSLVGELTDWPAQTVPHPIRIAIPCQHHSCTIGEAASTTQGTHSQSGVRKDVKIGHIQQYKADDHMAEWRTRACSTLSVWRIHFELRCQHIRACDSQHESTASICQWAEKEEGLSGETCIW